jgi:hypothetical protein
MHTFECVLMTRTNTDEIDGSSSRLQLFDLQLQPIYSVEPSHNTPVPKSIVVVLGNNSLTVILSIAIIIQFSTELVRWFH